MSSSSRMAIELHSIQRQPPSLVAKRLTKSTVTPPARRPADSSSVRARSSSWTNSTKGRERSSSSLQPSASVHDGLSCLK